MRMRDMKWLRTEGEGNVDEFDLLEDDGRVGNEVPEDDTNTHSEDDPEGQKLVQEGKSLESRD